MLKAFSTVIQIKVYIVNSMRTLRLTCCTTACKSLLCHPRTCFDGMGLKKRNGKKWYLIYRIDCSNGKGKVIDKSFVNWIMNCLKIEDFQRNMLKGPLVYSV